MTENEFYKKSLEILENFLDESRSEIVSIKTPQIWKERLVYFQFNQSINICYALLSNSEGSKFQNDTYVIELSFIGTIGRLLRDIYVNIIYLKSSIFSESDMQLCWNYQIVAQKLNTIAYDFDTHFEAEISSLKSEKETLKSALKNIPTSTIGKILQGKEDKLLSITDLSSIKGFNVKKFQNEFGYFSQFAHNTAFANNYLTEKGVRLDIIAITYHRIVPYFVGIVYESLELLNPKHPQLLDLKVHYEQIITTRWN